MLLSKYNLIMEDMKQKREKEGRKLESYNFLLLREWMFVVPRSCVTLFCCVLVLGIMQWCECEQSRLFGLFSR